MKKKNNNITPQQRKIDSTLNYAVFKTKTNIQLDEKRVIPQNHIITFPNNNHISDKIEYVCELNDIIQPIPKNPQDLNNKKILIIRTGGLGDIIASLYLVNEIKKRFPLCKILYLSAYHHNDLLKIFYKFLFGISDVIVSVDTIKDFDYYINLDNTIETSVFANSKTIQQIFANQVFDNIEFSTNSTDDIINNNDIFNKITNSKNFKRSGIGIHYSSSSRLRSYPIEQTIELIDLLFEKYPNEQIYLINPPSNFVESEYIYYRIKNNKNFFITSEIDCVTINDLFSLITNLKLVIGIDSSIVHLAGVCKTPILGIYGPFASSLRIKYYYNSIGIDAQADCSPCFRHEPESFCKVSHNEAECIRKTITPQFVLETLENNFNKILMEE